ncbi:MAG: hypothetical protein QGG23_03670 [Candidatus Bathyarchaeota archaeon]|nr:hypothetical protein [Candidatus Bathyarchaeota archaeon]
MLLFEKKTVALIFSKTTETRGTATSRNTLGNGILLLERGYACSLY